jgi:hypothetical protein
MLEQGPDDRLWQLISEQLRQILIIDIARKTHRFKRWDIRASGALAALALDRTDVR